MTTLSSLNAKYQADLPTRIREYLRNRGIADEIIDLHHLGWNGQRITIPLFNQEGILASFKLAKDPEDQTSSPKMMSSRGAKVELYGWERVLAKPYSLIICEGEFDRLVLEAQGFAAVTSTGGAGSFRAEWTADLASIPEIYLCFDRDAVGRQGAHRVAQFLPNAKVVEFPEEVGPKGDVTDFFVRLGRTREDFERLLESAIPLPVPPVTLPVVPAPRPLPLLDDWHQRIVDLKAATPISEVVGHYVALHPSGTSLRGRCPFHDDHDPSLMVYPLGGTFRCYGCGTHGDVITFLMAIEQFPFMRALDALEHFQSDDHGQPSTQP